MKEDCINAYAFLRISLYVCLAVCVRLSVTRRKRSERGVALAKCNRHLKMNYSTGLLLCIVFPTLKSRNYPRRQVSSGTKKVSPRFCLRVSLWQKNSPRKSDKRSSQRGIKCVSLCSDYDGALGYISHFTQSRTQWPTTEKTYRKKKARVSRKYKSRDNDVQQFKEIE